MQWKEHMLMDLNLFCIRVGCMVLHRKWVAYSKLYQTLEVDSTVLFQQLTSIEYHWDQQELPYLQVGDSFGGFAPVIWKLKRTAFRGVDVQN